MTTLIGPSRWTDGETGDISFPVSSPGVIGAAVIRAARRSADLSRRDLARAAAISSATIRGWEDGSRPLFCVRYDRLRQLADALRQAGARVGHEVSELVLASQCDLLITGILRGFEDYAEVLPIDEDTEGEAARGLLRWALSGAPPERYCPYTTPGPPLLCPPDVILLAATAQDLQASAHDSGLVCFGQALADLTAR